MTVHTVECPECSEETDVETEVETTLRGLADKHTPPVNLKRTLCDECRHDVEVEVEIADIDSLDTPEGPGSV